MTPSNNETLSGFGNDENFGQNPHPKPARKTRPWKAIRERRKLLAAQEKLQTEGIESQQIFKDTVQSKLLKAGAEAYCAEKEQKWMFNFERCGVDTYVLMCELCERVKDCTYQCSLKWCPRCNWRIAAKRRDLLKRITNGMNGVRHVVLTQKNFEHLTREKIQASRKALLDLRRQGIFGSVTGGCASLEFTNEKAGWHMHWHLLVQSQFIPADQLAIAWGRLVGQEFAIVKVKLVGEKDYLQELCKYIVDGSELARWTPAQILEFVIALRGTRCFTVWGKFREIARFARAVTECDKPEPEPCECGCDSFVFAESELQGHRIIRRLHEGG